MTKGEISAQLRSLSKYGYLVYTFNSNKRMRGACQGWVDHVVIDKRKGIVYFLEVKIGPDSLRAAQIELKTALISMESKQVRYRIVTVDNMSTVIDEIVAGK